MRARTRTTCLDAVFAVFTLTYIASHWEFLSGRRAHTDVNLHLNDFDADRAK